VSIHGKINHPQRVKILEDFKKGGRDDARVLLISNVGSTGLNIAFANILIIVVSGTRVLLQCLRS
jgi:superfamily II DNA/RNA helicase